MRKVLSAILIFVVMLFTLPTFAKEIETAYSEAAGNPAWAVNRRAEEAAQKKQLKPFSVRLKEKMEAEKMQVEQQHKRQVAIEDMPKVAVMYINDAQTTFDEDIDQVVLANLAKSISPEFYLYIDGNPYIERLSKIGIVDITTAERTDIIDAFEGEDIDYAVFLQIDPFVRKNKNTVFTLGKEMTAIVPFKIIDVKRNKYLYNGRFVEIAKKSSWWGRSGNKS